MRKFAVLVLTVICMFSLVGCETKYDIEKALMEKGPWSSEAIWMDDSSQLYLVCTKSNNDLYAAVVAYLSIDGEWCSAQLDLYQGVPIVCFSTPDGERVLEARAKMDGKKLRLYEFKAVDENYTVQYADIELSKFSYKDYIDKVPFEIMK